MSRTDRPRRITPTAVVAVVLALLLVAAGWLYLNRPPGQSPIELTAFEDSLSAARTGVVAVTSFDYQTIDEDIAEVEEVATGALRDEVLATLTERREQLILDEQVSLTEVVEASLTEASPDRATALIVLRVRQTSVIEPDATFVGYRVEVSLELVDGRWLLSALTGI